MYNVYLISMSYIYLPYFILLNIYALYESTPYYIPIHHVMHVEYGNKSLLLLYYFRNRDDTYIFRKYDNQRVVLAVLHYTANTVCSYSSGFKLSVSPSQTMEYQ